MKEDVVKSIFSAAKDSGNGLPQLVVAALIMSLLGAFIKYKGDDYKDNDTVKAIVLIAFIAALVLIISFFLSFCND